jgi:hypothetical protein
MKYTNNTNNSYSEFRKRLNLPEERKEHLVPPAP